VRDPLGQLIASDHNYGGLSPCERACRATILATHRRVPVLFGELGETGYRAHLRSLGVALRP
jgi:hypothetical protein